MQVRHPRASPQGGHSPRAARRRGTPGGTLSHPHEGHPTRVIPTRITLRRLALLSLIAFLGVVVLGGAFYVVRAIKSGLGLAGRGSDGGEDPWRGMAGDAHPLDDIEGQHSAR